MNSTKDRTNMPLNARLHAGLTRNAKCSVARATRLLGISW